MQQMTQRCGVSVLGEIQNTTAQDNEQLGLIPKLDLDWPWVGLDEIWIALLTPRRQPYPFKCHCYGHMGLTLLIQQLFVLYRGLNKTKQQGYEHAALDAVYSR